MIFADKLIQLRKKNGWSQEELAEQMNVTRQSVSKWEGAQSIPDLEKMIRLSELFGVSMDYLLKDEMEETEAEHVVFREETMPIRRVTMEDANRFLSIKAAESKSAAYAAFLCILSPICLLVLGAVSEISEYGISDSMAGGIGMIVLLVLIASAVAVFIINGNKASSFAYLEKEIFETEYGVSGMVKERREAYRNTYLRNNVIGTCLCILSLIPLFGGVIIDEENDFLMTMMLPVTFVIAGIGVVLFIRGGIIWASYEKLLQEGDYSKEKKEKSSLTAAISGSYWLIVTAVFLAYSFATNNWGYSWIVWVVAGLLYPVVLTIFNVIIKNS